MHASLAVPVEMTVTTRNARRTGSLMLAFRRLNLPVGSPKGSAGGLQLDYQTLGKSTIPVLSSCQTSEHVCPKSPIG